LGIFSITIFGLLKVFMEEHQAFHFTQGSTRGEKYNLVERILAQSSIIATVS
jgi:hypothetical protein